jgi:pimeloyl-ACP methyl ester carboxylesterase
MGTEFPHVDGVEHRFVEAGGVRFHVAEAGSGHPVVMIHGWPQHWYAWRRIIPLLADRYRLICPDLRGFGWSDTPGRGYDPETFASDTIALLDALEIQSANVIGHDWGGYSAVLLGIEHPSRIERVLAINTPHPWFPRTPAIVDQMWRSWYAWLMAAPWLGAWVLRRRPQFISWLCRADNVHPAIDEQDARIYAERLAEPERARATTLLYRRYLREFTDVLRRNPAELRMAVPARLLFGAQDLAISSSLAVGFEAGGDDCALELVPDSGHFLPEERPDLVAERARDFFG